MASKTVTNQKTTFDADTNTDLTVATNTGNADDNTQRVVLATDQPAVPVSGTITSNLSATDNAVLDSIAANTTLPTSIDSGVKSVTTAGTAETLVASSTPCKKVILLADPGNTTDEIYYGASDVNSTTGMIVYSAQKEVIEIDDAQKIYVDVGTNGDSIRYIILA